MLSAIMKLIDYATTMNCEGYLATKQALRDCNEHCLSVHSIHRELRQSPYYIVFILCQGALDQKSRSLMARERQQYQDYCWSVGVTCSGLAARSRSASA